MSSYDDWRRLCSAGELREPALLPRRGGVQHVQDIPQVFGRVVSCERRKGKLVARTETGGVVVVRT